jgi:hypothetical protein
MAIILDMPCIIMAGNGVKEFNAIIEEFKKRK